MNFDLVTKHVTPPDLVIDVGANVGAWIREAKAVWPDAEYFAIEGNSECREMLELLGEPYKIALLSDREKEVTFYTMKDCPTATGASIYLEQTEFFKGNKAVPHVVLTTTLDNVCSNAVACGGDILLKLDVQGSELDILKGAKEILPKITAIIIEVSYVEYNRGAPLFPEVCHFLTDQGFYVVEKLEEIVHPITREHIQSDILWRRLAE